MKISAIKYFSTVNGSGFRTAVFVSGCNLHCKGCFNSEAWDFEHGVDAIDELINKILDSIEPSYIAGLSILGGEPMDVRNQHGVSYLITKFRERFGETKNIWLYTGYVYGKSIPKTDDTENILSNVNVLVDGPFDIDKYDGTLAFRGSSNQRILHLK